MSIAYTLRYEDMTKKYNVSKGVGNMSNKQEVPMAKTRKVYEKSRTEHIKDIVIAVLITAVIAFVCGVHYANSQREATDTAVNKAVQSVKASQTATAAPKA